MSSIEPLPTEVLAILRNALGRGLLLKTTLQLLTPPGLDDLQVGAVLQPVEDAALLEFGMSLK